MAHLGEVLTRQEQFEKRNTKLVVIVQARPDVLQKFLARTPYPVSFVCDPERAAYRQFQLRRNSLISFLRPWEVWGYLKVIFRGYGPHLPYEGEDPQQLGGDFLLNRAGEVLYEARPEGATDRPSVEQMLAAVPPGLPG